MLLIGENNATAASAVAPIELPATIESIAITAILDKEQKLAGRYVLRNFFPINAELRSINSAFLLLSLFIVYILLILESVFLIIIK